MSYDSVEQSVHDGAPIEVYKFIGTFKTYRYTSWHEEITVNGELYEPIYIKRGTVKAGTQDDTNIVLEITVPFDLEMAKDYAYAVAPPSLTMELRRVHKGTDYGADWKLAWVGTVRGFAVANRECTLTIPSIFNDVLEGNVPNIFFQNPCNHTLYDVRCGVSRAANTTTSTVVSVDGVTVEVVDDGTADNVMAAGELINTRTGERRLILSNVVNVIGISFPFVDCQVGDTVQMSKGCDLAFSTCVNSFANGDRFGGDPYMPGDNPFNGSL